MTKEEKAVWDQFRKGQTGAADQEIAKSVELLKRDPNKAINQFGVFQSVPNEPSITCIQRVIVDPKDSK